MRTRQLIKFTGYLLSLLFLIWGINCRDLPRTSPLDPKSPRYTLPPTPQINKITLDFETKKIIIYWQIEEEKEEKVAGFRLYKSTDGKEYQQVGKDLDKEDRSYEDENTEVGKTYYYCVSSFNKLGVESTRSEVRKITFERIPPPATPVGFSGHAAEDGIILQWRENTEENLAGYRLYRKKKNETWPSPPRLLKELGKEKTEYKDKEVERGEIYHYKISAFNALGLESELSEEIEVSFLGVPVRPQKLKITVENRKIILTWAPNTESDLKEYQIYRKVGTAGGFDFYQTVSKSAPLKLNDVNLQNRTIYGYKIKAVNQKGEESEFSETVFGIPEAGEPNETESKATKIEVSTAPTPHFICPGEEVDWFCFSWEEERIVGFCFWLGSPSDADFNLVVKTKDEEVLAENWKRPGEKLAILAKEKFKLGGGQKNFLKVYSEHQRHSASPYYLKVISIGQEREPNDDMIHCQRIPPIETLTEIIIKGTLSSNTDKDFYEFSSYFHSPRIVISLYLDRAPQSNYDLYLYAEGEEVARSIQGVGKDEEITYNFAERGPYCLEVRFGGGEIGASYYLHLSWRKAN
jgi:fibronectin type 3 domain-containing protein